MRNIFMLKTKAFQRDAETLAAYAWRLSRNYLPALSNPSPAATQAYKDFYCKILEEAGHALVSVEVWKESYAQRASINAAKAAPAAKAKPRKRKTGRKVR